MAKKKSRKSRQSKAAGNDIFDVEEVIGSKVVNNKTFYLIKWVGYPKSESTWEPIENLENVHELIAKYEKTKEEGKDSAETKVTEEAAEINEEQEKLSSEGSEGALDGENEGGRGDTGMKVSVRKKGRKNNVGKIAKKHVKRGTGFRSSSFSNTVNGVNKKYGHMIKVMQVQKGKNGMLEAVIETILDGITKMIVINCKELRKVNPDILLDFYESRISFYNKE